jgi:hypothetical protein
VDLPKGLRMMVNQLGEQALCYDPDVYSIDPMGDVIVVTNLARRATELIIPGRTTAGPAKVGIICQCGEHVITSADC